MLHIGYFDENTGEIVLNAEANNPIQVVLKHELTHTIEGNKNYAKFSDSVLNNAEFKAWLRNNGYADLADAQNKTIAFRKKKGDTNFKKKGATQEELNTLANQELLADFIAEKLFNDADGLERLLKSLEPKTMRDFVQTILDVIRKLINKIKGVDNSFEEDLRTLEKKFSKMLKETAKNEKSTGEGVKNSLSPTKIKKLEQILDNLGKKQIKVKGEDKTLTILTDKFTRNKAIFSTKGRTNGEVNARIKAIPDFESILRKAGTFKKENLTSLDNDAKKGVVAIYKGKTHYNGYDIEIVIRDKGAKQYLYETKFIDPKNKKSSRQSMTEYSVSPASQSEDATSKYNIPQTKQPVNKKLSVTPETDAEYMSAVENGDIETAQRLVIIESERDTSRDTENSEQTKAIQYSITDDTVSTRSALADALSTLTQDESEMRIIEDYKNAVADIDKAQARLDQVNADIKQILFTPGERDVHVLEALIFSSADVFRYQKTRFMRVFCFK